MTIDAVPCVCAVCECGHQPPARQVIGRENTSFVYVITLSHFHALGCCTWLYIGRCAALSSPRPAKPRFQASLAPFAAGIGPQSRWHKQAALPWTTAG